MNAKRKIKPKVIQKSKPKMGRPSKKNTIDIEHLKFLIVKGFTDFEICQFYKISRETLYAWQRIDKELSDAIKGWKKYANARVERSLYERACGYSHPTEEIFCAFGKVTRVKTIKHYPPSEIAGFYWLNNRSKGEWSNKPPDAEDESLKDQELIFHNVPNQKDPGAMQRFAKFYDQN